MADQNVDMSNEDRNRLLREAAGFLVTIGLAMVQQATKERDGSATAVGVCVQIAGDLSRGVQKLIEDRNFYGAAALSRQALESTQLIRYLKSSPDRAEFWLTASDDEIRTAKDFKPSNLRQSTRSIGRMYHHHCFLGGHPRSIAQYLLPGSPWKGRGTVIDLSPAGFTVDADIQTLLVVDALQHVYDAVLATIEALDMRVLQTLGSQETAENLISTLVQDLASWRQRDPLAAVGSVGT